MIRFAFKRPDVSGPHADGPIGSDVRSFYVVHPSNGAILAYCSTKKEADAVAKAIEDLFAVVREVANGEGEKS